MQIISPFPLLWLSSASRDDSAGNDGIGCRIVGSMSRSWEDLPKDESTLRG
jgi:hypothetical protein